MSSNNVSHLFMFLGAYDANVDMFERGMRTDRLNEIFSTVKPNLVPLIRAIADSSAKKSYQTPEPLKVLKSSIYHCAEQLNF